MCSQEIHDPRSKLKSLGKTLTSHDPDVGIGKGFEETIRNVFKGAEKKMAQCLTVLTTLGGGQGFLSSSHVMAHNDI